MTAPVSQSIKSAAREVAASFSSAVSALALGIADTNGKNAASATASAVTPFLSLFFIFLQYLVR